MPPRPSNPSIDVGTHARTRRQRASADDAGKGRGCGQQLEHFAPKYRIRAVFDDKALAIGRRKRGGFREQRLRTIPHRAVHVAPLIRRPSQNRAAAIFPADRGGRQVP